jgi:hypothetical protein
MKVIVYVGVSNLSASKAKEWIEEVKLGFKDFFDEGDKVAYIGDKDVGTTRVEVLPDFK